MDYKKFIIPVLLAVTVLALALPAAAWWGGWGGWGGLGCGTCGWGWGGWW